MTRPSHDPYGAIFGECACRGCQPRPEPDEEPEPETDHAAEWAGQEGN